MNKLTKVKAYLNEKGIKYSEIKANEISFKLNDKYVSVIDFEESTIERRYCRGVWKTYGHQKGVHITKNGKYIKSTQKKVIEMLETI